MENSAPEHVSAALQRLNQRCAALRDIVQRGIPSDAEEIAAAEALAEELRAEHEDVVGRFAHNPVNSLQMRKLSKDLAKLTPQVMDVMGKASQACSDARRRAQTPAQEQQATAQPQQPPPPKQQQQQQQTQQDRLNDEYERQIEREMQVVQTKASTVRSLTENVAQLVVTQHDDTALIGRNTDTARNDVMAGLGELAELKKREAGKHTTRGTTMSAVVGGAVGLVGGPLGVMIGVGVGAAVGAVIGSSVASLSRRSIDSEVRAFKRKFQVHINPDGSCVTFAQAFENQRWSVASRVWSGENLVVADFRDPWSLDELGTSLRADDPNPLNPFAPPKPPGQTSSSPPDADLRRGPPAQQPPHPQAAYGNTTTSNDLEEEEEENVASPSRPELGGPPPASSDASQTFGGRWRWAENSKWMPDVGDTTTDTGAWKYSFSFADGSVWYAEPSRTTLVRRRRWIREQVLDADKASFPESIARVLMARQRAEADARVQRAAAGNNSLGSIPLNARATQHAQDATRQMDESLQVSRATLDELRAQGSQISDANVDVAIVEDAAAHAQRVSRAVSVGGVIRNAFSRAPDHTERALQRQRDANVYQQQLLAGAAPPPSPQSPAAAASPREERVGWEQHPLSTLERMCDEQLQLSKSMKREVDAQNLQLDALLEASARTELNVSKAKDMI